MTVVDTNVLVYARHTESPMHRAAHARVVEFANSAARWGIPVFGLGEFVRVVIHPKLFDPPLKAEPVCRALAALLASPSVVLSHPGAGYPALYFEAIHEANGIGNLAFCAQIMALFREQRVSRLVTEDRDFGRFAGLRVERLQA